MKNDFNYLRMKNHKYVVKYILNILKDNYSYISNEDKMDYYDFNTQNESNEEQKEQLKMIEEVKKVDKGFNRIYRKQRNKNNKVVRKSINLYSSG